MDEAMTEECLREASDLLVRAMRLLSQCGASAAAAHAASAVMMLPACGQAARADRAGASSMPDNTFASFDLDSSVNA